MPTARERLVELMAKVDAFFGRVHERFPGVAGVTCHAGCDDCCRRRFSVTAIEAELIAEAVAAQGTARAASADDTACVFLGPDGRCAVYEARPLICRSHGLPIRYASGARVLPLVDACPRNFEGRAPASLPADCILDQATVSTILGVLDAARAAELGQAGRDRVELSAMLAPGTVQPERTK